ncbi:uncharacterized protein NESG_01459 [Nematocida ausubeli]|uniref:Uncharacterized protein n=1 Tax=Nematocida ausubeli (strain ATCC PRA-371 / ERTm2) TaxID=1913371 RepID=A0A086J2H0_NEMA1|nr:uncharacterized protein NESG_01459 [Nematocida ausubeli]KAI5132621.1 hypothetical protein NEAUS06_0270 [Nematocida ausubeli]KFG26338.1 hypothetical protein NESG_01459 [Nematocida ausubeli]
MAVECITVCFPFKLQGVEYRTKLHTPLTRKENIVIFSLPFNSLIRVNSEKAYSVKYIVTEKKEADVMKILYQIIIEFKSINDAIDFFNTPVVHVSYSETTLLQNLDEKLAEASDILEKTGQSWKKKRKTEVDEEGYFTC